MLLSALLFFIVISGTFGFDPVPRYGETYNPFLAHFFANQWWQPYYYRQNNNYPELFNPGKIKYLNSLRIYQF
jgi:hypothetical protein